MRVGKRLKIKFVAIFVAMASPAGGQDNFRDVYNNAVKEDKVLAPFLLDGSRSSSFNEGEDSPEDLDPGKNTSQKSAIQPLIELSEAADSGYIFLRAQIRIDRNRRFDQYREEMRGLGLSSANNDVERLDALIYPMFSYELVDLFNNRVAALQGVEVGSDAYFNGMRELGLVGYYYGWSLLDSRDSNAARAVEVVLDAAFAPYIEAPPPQLALSVIRYLRLKSQIAWNRGDAGEQVRFAQLARSRAERIDVYPPDYVLLARMKARILLGESAGSEKAKGEACKIFESLTVLRPADLISLRGYVDCQIDLAGKMERREGIATLDVTNEYLSGLQNTYPDIAKEIGILQLRVLNALARRERDRPLTKNSDTYRYLAATGFINELKNIRYRNNSYWELSDIYFNFSELNFENVSRNIVSVKGYRDGVELFLAIADAVELSRAADPGSPDYALVSADSLARAAQLMLDRGDNPGADAVSARAERIMDQTGIIDGLVEVDERAQSECLVRNRRIRVLIALEQTDAAIAAYQRFDQSCGVWVRTYPWEFNARQYATDISNRLGNHLRLKGRLADAVPMLAYASAWGVKDASAGLALIHGDPASPLADPEKAKRFETLAEKQSTRRFTVQADFDGAAYPFNVYLFEYGEGPLCGSTPEPRDPSKPCAGYAGIDDQEIWISQLRGGKIPDDVASRFSRLYRIAQENSVSFPEFVHFALAEANKPEIAATDDQIEAIYKDMLAANFRRNPDRWLDPAGLALKGYDAVSYTQGDAPVIGNAAFYALWDGALWLFKDAANRDRFTSNPDRFAPQYGGFSAWEIMSKANNPGDPTFFSIVDDKLFLFDNQDHIADWEADATSLTDRADKAWLSVFPAKIDATSNIAYTISKLGGVADADRIKTYILNCEKGMETQCIKRLNINYTPIFFKPLSNILCETYKSIGVCTYEVGLAEEVGDMVALVSLLGSRSWYLAQANKPDEAIADAKRALAIDPDQPWIRGNLANGLLIKGQIDEAIAIYRELKDQPGPDEKSVMCKFILDDIDVMLTAKVISAGVAEAVRREIVCQ